MPNWNVEQLGRAFILLSFLMAALSMLRAFVYAQKLHTYMKSHHFDRWKEFLGEGTALFRNICLKPLNSDKSCLYFFLWSNDDFGDRQVQEYRRHVRAWMLGYLVSVVAAMIGFVMIVIVRSAKG